MILSRSVGHWIISGNTGDPFSSPWVIFEAEIRRVKLKTLKDLMEGVTDFVGSLSSLFSKLSSVRSINVIQLYIDPEVMK